MTGIQELLRIAQILRRERPQSIIIHPPDGERQEELETKCAALLESEDFDGSTFAKFTTLIIDLVGGNENGLGEKGSKYLYDDKAQVSISFEEAKKDGKVVHTLKVLHDQIEGIAQNQEVIAATDYENCEERYSILDFNVSHAPLQSYVLERRTYTTSPSFRRNNIQKCCRKVFDVYQQTKRSPQTAHPTAK